MTVCSRDNKKKDYQTVLCCIQCIVYVIAAMGARKIFCREGVEFRDALFSLKNLTTFLVVTLKRQVFTVTLPMHQCTKHFTTFSTCPCLRASMNDYSNRPTFSVTKMTKKSRQVLGKEKCTPREKSAHPEKSWLRV